MEAAVEAVEAVEVVVAEEEAAEEAAVVAEEAVDSTHPECTTECRPRYGSNSRCHCTMPTFEG